MQIKTHGKYDLKMEFVTNKIQWSKTCDALSNNRHRHDEVELFCIKKKFHLHFLLEG